MEGYMVHHGTMAMWLTLIIAIGCGIVGGWLYHQKQYQNSAGFWSFSAGAFAWLVMLIRLVS